MADQARGEHSCPFVKIASLSPGDPIRNIGDGLAMPLMSHKAGLCTVHDKDWTWGTANGPPPETIFE